MLSLCGADWEPRFVDFFNGETRTPEFRKINEMGEVPVLEHRQMRLSQSGVILDYLAGRFGKFGWADEDERREILRWLLWDNHKLTSYIGTLRFLTRFMKTGETPVTEFLRGRVKGALASWTATSRTATSRSPGARRSPISRCAATCTLARRVRRRLDRLPRIGAWLGRIGPCPAGSTPIELMPGHPLPERAERRSGGSARRLRRDRRTGLKLATDPVRSRLCSAERTDRLAAGHGSSGRGGPARNQETGGLPCTARVCGRSRRSPSGSA